MRSYYAATLRGDGEPLAIDEVYVFDYFSQRRQWLSEGENRVKLGAKIAKKHKEIIEVTVQHYVTHRGYAGWVWMYDGRPENDELKMYNENID